MLYEFHFFRNPENITKKVLVRGDYRLQSKFVHHSEVQALRSISLYELIPYLFCLLPILRVLFLFICWRIISLASRELFGKFWEILTLRSPGAAFSPFSN